VGERSGCGGCLVAIVVIVGGLIALGLWVGKQDEKKADRDAEACVEEVYASDAVSQVDQRTRVLVGRPIAWTSCMEDRGWDCDALADCSKGQIRYENPFAI
jgi:hypothetical protein